MGFNRTTNFLPSDQSLSVLSLFFAWVLTSIYLMVFSTELSPLELSAFLNALPCSLAFHRDASFEFKDLIKEVPKSSNRPFLAINIMDRRKKNSEK